MATHGNSKALFGALFLQYCSYSVFYILDELQSIAPPHYRALIKEQEKEVQMPFSKKKDKPEATNQSKRKKPKKEEDEDDDEAEE